MPGIVEVARKAGVSITTVSRTFNPVSDYPVAQATRQRVLAAAAALQYSPSALARALVTRRSRIVGVVVGDIVDPYFAEIARGIEDVARAWYLNRLQYQPRSGHQTALRRPCATIAPTPSCSWVATSSRDQPACVRATWRRSRAGAPSPSASRAIAAAPAFDIDHTAAAEGMTLPGRPRPPAHRLRRVRSVTTAGQRLAGSGRMTASGLSPDLVDDGDFAYSGGLAAAARLLERRRRVVRRERSDGARRAGGVSPCWGGGTHGITVVGFGNTAAAEHAVPA
jgi:LacI family transcriptional regulator